MPDKVIINDYKIKTKQLEINTLEQDRKKLNMTFQVFHENYHDVTTLLYQNDFKVEVPSHQLQFSAVIHRYSTSIDNLYKENAIGTFDLELVEKA
ncbi:MAG TPA: DUF3219 family protein [Pseudogracilibacillus sp.]|nr:DUF3219 family protein [Pseudogracilibacillus sp.]